MAHPSPNYSASISFKGAGAEKLEKLLALESREGENDRAEFKVEKSGDSVTIRVSAADSVALRACLVSVTKILTIHERISAFPEGKGE